MLFGKFWYQWYRIVSSVTSLVILLLATGQSLYAEVDTGSSQRGRQIFFQGEISSGDSLTANVGAASIPVPATALPCVGCHGRDGKGRPEGGVRPSDITWFNLTKEYGGVTLIGRRYKAYDASSFLTAVSEGLDSAGNRLDNSMPRYNISRQDARDLVAYLKVIQDDYDPGVTSDQIVFGSLQPEKQLQAGVANAMVAVMQAQFDEINRQGGIYGRHLKLKVIPYEDRQSFIAEANKLISGNQVFALLSPFSAGADHSLIDMVEQAEMPSIAPFTQFPAEEDGRHNYTFYLHGGLNAQIAALAKRAGENGQKGDQAFVFYQQDGEFEGSANKALTYLQENNIENPQLVAYPNKTAKKLSEFIDLTTNPNPVILFLGSSRDLVSLLGKPTPGQKLPHLYLPGFFVNSFILNLADGYAKQLEMAYITVPGSNNGEELSKFRQFMRRNKLDHNYLTARLFAYSATETLIEGVKRSGKRITRNNLVDAVEELYGFDAGLNQPINFGSRRRTGLLGAHMVKFDTEMKRLTPTGTWVRLD